MTGVNTLSIQGFQLYELKEEIGALQEQNDELRLKTMSLESYAKISQRADDLKMVRVDRVDYLVIEEGAVAVK